MISIWRPPYQFNFKSTNGSYGNPQLFIKSNLNNGKMSVLSISNQKNASQGIGSVGQGIGLLKPPTEPNLLRVTANPYLVAVSSIFSLGRRAFTFIEIYLAIFDGTGKLRAWDSRIMLNRDILLGTDDQSVQSFPTLSATTTADSEEFSAWVATHCWVNAAGWSKFGKIVMGSSALSEIDVVTPWMTYEWL